MKLSGADLPRLRWSVLAALLAIAAGAGGSYLALDSARRARAEQAAAQQARNEIEGKLKRVRGEEAEIKQKSALFNALRARGVIGDEQRLEWVELMRAISDRRRLLELHYEFAPQRPLDAAPGAAALPANAAAAADAYTFYVSSMTLELKLLHEEDLTRLLADLRQQASALIQVRRCSVERLARGAEGANTAQAQAQLQARCQIDWITLRSGAAGAAP